MRRAPRRHAADRVWALLLVVTFALVAAAAASAPLVVESAENAAVRRVLEATPEGAGVSQMPILRITGGPNAPVAGTSPDLALDEVPGLGPRRVLGVSFGDELSTRGELWRSVVEPAAGGVEPLDRRLAALDGLADRLVPVAGGAPADAAGSVWVDEDAAAAIGVGPGDEIRVSISTRDSAGSVVLPVAGVYALAAGGTGPADVDGSTFWRDLTGRLPQPTGQARAVPALLTDVATLDEVAEPLGEEVLWSVEAGLDPATPTLRELAATAAGMDEVRRRLPPLPTIEGARGRYLVAGGIPDLHALSASIASTAVDRTRGAAWSALALAGLVVLVVTVVDDARRRQERRLESAMGLHPLQVGGLRALEVAPLAVAGVAAGVAVAWAVVTRWGPRGAISGETVLVAAQHGAAGAAVALLLVVAVSAGSAWSTGRLSTATGTPGAPGAPRGLAWRTALVAGAAATVAGVLTGAEAGGGLEVVAPLMLAASCGAVLASGSKALLRRGLSARGRRRTGGAVRPMAGRPLAPGRAGTVLALRRLAAPGDGQDAVVVLLTAGLAVAGYVALADRSLLASVESKSAVLAGAASTVELPSGQALALAPDPVRRPEVLDEFVYDAQLRPFDLDLAPAADIPVPEGDTVVWLDQVAPDGERQLPLYVLDTDTAPSALDFGSGSGALVDARRALADLTQEAAARAPGEGRDPPPPVILVGEPRGLSVGDEVELAGTFSLVTVEVVAAVPVFPGQGSRRSMLVADTDTYLPAQQLADPRYLSDDTGSPLELQAEYWSSRGAADVSAHIRDAGLPVEEVLTAATRQLQPGFVASELVQGYQVAVAVLLVVAAVVGLAVRADRGADRALPAAVVLRRTPLGRGGVRRALLLELAGVVVVSVLAAALALVLLVPLTPALVDPSPELPPRLDVTAWAQLVGLLVIVATAVVPLALAAAATVQRLRGTREEVVLRDDR